MTKYIKLYNIKKMIKIFMQKLLDHHTISNFIKFILIQNYKSICKKEYLIFIPGDKLMLIVLELAKTRIFLYIQLVVAILIFIKYYLTGL